MRSAFRPLLLTVVAFSQVACASIWKASVGAGNRAEFRGTAGAGFAGVRVAEVLRAPVIPAAPGAPDSVDLLANDRVSWKPALSTGLQAMFYSKTTSGAGGGLGAHMVFVPDATGRTSAFPALTLHLGNRGHEVFLGALFMWSDNVRFPNGANTYRIARPANDAYPDFVLESERRWRLKSPTWYMGIQVGGIRLGERDAQEASEAGRALAARDIDFAGGFGGDSALRVQVDATRNLPAADVIGPNNRKLDVTVLWASEDVSVATIVDNTRVMGVKAGTAYLVAKAGSVAKRLKVIVEARPST